LYSEKKDIYSWTDWADFGLQSARERNQFTWCLWIS
jgi:hypothetical protein